MDIHNTGILEKVYKWIDLPKNKYYHVKNVVYINSNFHEDKVPLFQLNNKWYWVPYAQHKRSINTSTKFFIYAGEKKDCENTPHKYWNILYYKGLPNIIRKEYNNIIKNYDNFCEEQLYDKELKFTTFLKFINNDNVMTFLPNKKGIYKILLYFQAKLSNDDISQNDAISQNTSYVKPECYDDVIDDDDDDDYNPPVKRRRLDIDNLFTVKNDDLKNNVNDETISSHDHDNININSDPYLHSQELTPVFNYSLNKWVNKTDSKTI